MTASAPFNFVWNPQDQKPWVKALPACSLEYIKMMTDPYILSRDLRTHLNKGQTLLFKEDMVRCLGFLVSDLEPFQEKQMMPLMKLYQENLNEHPVTKAGNSYFLEKLEEFSKRQLPLTSDLLTSSLNLKNNSSQKINILPQLLILGSMGQHASFEKVTANKHDNDLLLRIFTMWKLSRAEPPAFLNKLTSPVLTHILSQLNQNSLPLKYDFDKRWPIHFFRDVIQTSTINHQHLRRAEKIVFDRSKHPPSAEANPTILSDHSDHKERLITENQRLFGLHFLISAGRFHLEYNSDIGNIAMQVYANMSAHDDVNFSNNLLEWLSYEKQFQIKEPADRLRIISGYLNDFFDTFAHEYQDSYTYSSMYKEFGYHHILEKLTNLQLKNEEWETLVSPDEHDFIKTEIESTISLVKFCEIHYRNHLWLTSKDNQPIISDDPFITDNFKLTYSAVHMISVFLQKAARLMGADDAPLLSAQKAIANMNPTWSNNSICNPFTISRQLAESPTPEKPTNKKDLHLEVLKYMVHQKLETAFNDPEAQLGLLWFWEAVCKNDNANTALFLEAWEPTLHESHNQQFITLKHKLLQHTPRVQKSGIEDKPTKIKISSRL